jgi:nucleoside-diphosphate-sugar epimerase
MCAMTRRAFIVGGTGQIGRAIAARLLDEGWRVALASRGRKDGADALVRRGAETVVLDRSVPGALAAALGDGADAVIDTVAYSEVEADQLLEVQADVGALVVVSSSSVYRDAAGRSLDEAGEGGFPEFPRPIREDQATVDPGPSTSATTAARLRSGSRPGRRRRPSCSTSPRPRP